MKTFKRICIKDFELKAENGDRLSLKRGEEYLTSEEENGKVVVLSNFWARVPSNLFAGEVKFNRR